MENMTLCQSCAMPMTQPEDFGTLSNGEKSSDYCHYCYANGAFLKEETMDEMIETCVPFVSNGNPYPDAQTARKQMQQYFPTLKRWNTQAK